LSSEIKSVASYWTFHSAGQIVFGPGSAHQIGSLTSALPSKRVLVITDKQLVAAGIIDPVLSSLKQAGLAVDVFDGGQPEPALRVADQSAAFARPLRPDVVIGLGGGSNMDLAKITAVILSHGGVARDYIGEARIPGPILPVVCIPTTAGTGSEVSCSAVLTDDENDVKVSTLSNYLRPRFAIVDPLLTVSCPRKVTADSGIDALTHVIEAYTATDSGKLSAEHKSIYQGRNPLCDALAERAIRLIGANLVTAVKNPRDLAAREAMSLGATLAGLAFSNAAVALVHALEYPVGAVTHCSHGAGNGLLLPHVMRFNLRARLKEFARVAELLGEDVRGLSDEQAAELAVAGVERLSRTIEIPQRLRDLGLSEQQLPALAEKTFGIKRLLRVNPREPSQADVLAILQAAY
jgi:alcohol dehydrogenase class IV